MRKKVYNAINVLVILLSLYFAWQMLRDTIQEEAYAIAFSSTNAYLLVFGILMIFVVNLFKALRMYFIIMELPISSSCFMKTFLKTSLVSIVLPYKSGEFFRVYCYGYVTRKWGQGMVSVLVDRYFDSIPVLICVVLYVGLRRISVSAILGILLAFVLLGTVCYLIFPSTYTYVKKFLFKKIHSAKSVPALKTLDMLNVLYGYCKAQVRQRAPILLLLSAFAWLAEFVALFCLSSALFVPWGVHDFIAYLNNVFLGYSGTVAKIYGLLSMLQFCVATAIVYIIVFRKRGKKI